MAAVVARPNEVAGARGMGGAMGVADAKDEPREAGGAGGAVAPALADAVTERRAHKWRAMMGPAGADWRVYAQRKPLKVKRRVRKVRVHARARARVPTGAHETYRGAHACADQRRPASPRPTLAMPRRGAACARRACPTSCAGSSGSSCPAAVSCCSRIAECTSSSCATSARPRSSRSSVTSAGPFRDTCSTGSATDRASARSSTCSRRTQCTTGTSVTRR